MRRTLAFLLLQFYFSFWLVALNLYPICTDLWRSEYAGLGLVAADGICTPPFSAMILLAVFNLEIN
jgi:hypothetical protein